MPMRNPTDFLLAAEKFMSTIRIAFTAGCALAILACSASDSLSPDERPESALKFLTLAPNAPPLATATVSFWAVKGKSRGADIWYRPRAGQRDSTKFLEFRLEDLALGRRPDGTLIATGDSIRITITVSDPTHLIVQFQPSGLTFSPKDPAHLKMFFGEVGDDLDHDGRVDMNDDEVERTLSIWRQEQPGLPWIKMASAVVHDSRRVDADLSGFTGYALAY